jgi:hypothetical protein
MQAIKIIIFKNATQQYADFNKYIPFRRELLDTSSDATHNGRQVNTGKASRKAFFAMEFCLVKIKTVASLASTMHTSSAEMITALRKYRTYTIDGDSTLQHKSTEI